MEEPAISSPQSEPPKLPRMSLAARLMNVFATPGDVFNEVKAFPHAISNWLVPALLFMMVSWVGSWIVLSQPAIRQQLTEITDKTVDNLVKEGKMSEQDAESMRPRMEMGSVVGTAVGPVFAAFFSAFFWALVLWLIGAKLMKGDFGYLKALEVAGLANTILVLEAVIKTLLIVLSGNLFASPSLALLIKDFDPQNSTHGLLAAVNVMTVWVLLVRAIGLARLANTSFSAAAAWVFAVWAGYTSLFIGIGYVMKMAFSK